MKALREVGLGLSVVFGCLLLVLVAELYYLLWWKKRVVVINRDLEADYNNICCKKLSFSFGSELVLNPLEICSSSDTQQIHEPQAQFLVDSHNFWNNDNNNKPFGEEQETVESELFRLQNFPGPPRFLFTINEETKEDLESEDNNKSRKSSRSKSLSDFLPVLETPYLTPMASPKYFTPPLTPVKSTNQDQGFCSFDSASEAEFNFLVRSSPPPKFQFLKDAEEKLYRKNSVRNQENSFGIEATCSSSEHDHHHLYVPNSSQILPMESGNVGS